MFKHKFADDFTHDQDEPFISLKKVNRLIGDFSHDCNSCHHSFGERYDKTAKVILKYHVIRCTCNTCIPK